MSNSKLTKVASAVRGSFDRRTAGGVVIGVAFMLSAMAFANNAGSTWFAPLGPINAPLGNPAMASTVSDAHAIMTEEIKAAIIKCRNAGLGKDIETAVAAHTELASAGPDVEKLFDINGDCFSSINQIYDLSVSIPSLTSILNAAIDVVKKYAEKKVCTAVNQVSGMVTSPINQAIGKINSLQGFANIDGMANDAIQGGMAQLDPQLGAGYQTPKVAGTYTINTNPFNANQTAFTPGGGQNGDINGNISQINALTQQVGAYSIAVVNDTQNINQIQQQLNFCYGQDNDCTNLEQAMNNAQAKLASDQQALALAQNQLLLLGQGGGGDGAIIPSAPAPAQAANFSTKQSAAPAANGAPKDFWSKVSGMFN